jgi:hypothetical protein
MSREEAKAFLPADKGSYFNPLILNTGPPQKNVFFLRENGAGADVLSLFLFLPALHSSSHTYTPIPRTHTHTHTHARTQALTRTRPYTHLRGVNALQFQIASHSSTAISTFRTTPPPAVLAPGPLQFQG